MSFCEKLTKKRKSGTGYFRQKRGGELYTKGKYTVYFWGICKNKMILSNRYSIFYEKRYIMQKKSQKRGLR